jgi:hypothetical protein
MVEAQPWEEVKNDTCVHPLVSSVRSTTRKKDNKIWKNLNVQAA